MDSVKRVLWTSLCVWSVACTEATVDVGARKKLAWPFSSASIWNTPIGGAARYVPANITGITAVTMSPSFLVTTTAQDPLRPLLAPAGPERCTGTLMLDMIRVPDGFVLDAAQNSSPGNSTSIVQPDGHSLVEIASLSRCDVGGPVFGFHYADADLYGDGRLGGQGGSGLSSLGGSLMPGELTDGRPVRHALKFTLPSRLYFFDAAVEDSCFRWPADRCDGGHAEPGDAMYGGSNPELTMGSLLAIDRVQDLDKLALKTQAGRLMAETLRDYGAYVVGTAGGDDAVRWVMNAAALTAFEGALGADFANWQEDVKAIMPLLQVVANNAATSVGGGGRPLAPVAPRIGD